MTLEFQEYQAREIINVYRHVDPWFWNKYSAHPYVGCRSGCEFCYLRSGRYLRGRDPGTFDTMIQVKTNAVELLRKELINLAQDVIACGDWQQPAEDRYQLSRKMLEVVLDLGFPLFVVERSPLLIRDLDLLKDINRKSWVGVVYSLSNLDPDLKQAYEPRSPGLRRRLKAMEALAEAGILVGTALMPVIPIVGDNESHLAEVVQATKDHGGTFVLAGSLTMGGVQAQRTLTATGRLNPAAVTSIRALYRLDEESDPSNDSPPSAYVARLGRAVRRLCVQAGLQDRMPRFVPDGPLETNKRIAERLFLKTYELEIEEQRGYRIWAYRKAAWTMDELQESVVDIYRAHGRGGLMRLPGIGQSLAREIEGWLQRPAFDKIP